VLNSRINKSKKSYHYSLNDKFALFVENTGHVIKYKKIPFYLLSDGEKTDLLYWINFIIKNNANLFIIDEPEASMHILWQAEFVDQLLKINNQKSKQFILSTHSPDIISNHTEFVINLGAQINE
jgi:predicted ATPase